MKRIASLAAAVLFLAPVAHSATFMHQADITKGGPKGYIVTCYSQAVGVDITHEYRVVLSISAPGGYFTFPYSVEPISATNRRAELTEPGVWDFNVYLNTRKGILTATRIFYTTAEVVFTAGGVACQGGIFDLTSNTPVAPAFLTYQGLRN